MLYADPFRPRILAFAVLATSIFSSAKSPDQADSRLVLNKITHKRSYTIEIRDRKTFDRFRRVFFGFVAIKRNENTLLPITWLAFVVELVDSHKVK